MNEVLLKDRAEQIPQVLTDENAVRQLVVANLGLVVKEAKKFTNRGVSMPDLVQEGSIGLLYAARRFDSSLGYSFSTYAVKWIRGWMQAYLLETDGLIRFSDYTAKQLKDLQYSRSELLKELEREPTEAELAQRSGFTEKQLKRLLELPQICSLDAPAGEDDSTLQQLLEDLQAPQPQQEIARQQLKNTLKLLLSRLTPRQRQVMQLRFGLDTGEYMSLSAVGQLLGISKQRARQLEQDALTKMREMGADLGLEDFLE